jgi:hypothetical protein
MGVDGRVCGRLRVMRNFVVTGTGRSGTTYTAQLLTSVGWACGHEDVFTPTLDRFDGFGDYVGDASWLAVPHLDGLPADVPVIHQVRDPLATIRSLASVAFFRHWWTPRALKFTAQHTLLRRSPSRGPFHAFARRHFPEVWEHWSPFTRAARHWVDWNLRVEAAGSARDYLRVRVEDIDGETLDALSELVGASLQPPARWPPATVNTRRGAFDGAGLDDLPAVLATDVAEVAGRYGYELRRPDSTR